MTITSNTSYAHFHKLLSGEYGDIEKLTYVDEENDHISIRNEHDFTNALNFYNNNTKKGGALRLTIHKPAQSLNSSTGGGGAAALNSSVGSRGSPQQTQSQHQPKDLESLTTRMSSMVLIRQGSDTQTVSRTGSGTQQMQKNTIVMASDSASSLAGALDALESTVGSGAAFKWTKGNLLGKGAFGHVYLGMRDNAKLLAVKVIELGNVSSDKEIVSFQKEITMLRDFQHPNIVRYLGCEYAKGDHVLNIFLEYVPGGSLQSWIKRFFPLPEKTIQLFTRQILTGLDYLHQHQIVHRDIKGDNILVDPSGIIKLADFGCSKQLNDLCSKSHGCNTMVGTPYWMAPEVITDDTGYGLKADVWSVGCTVVEMITGNPPWPEFQSMWAAIYHIANSTGPPSEIPADISPITREFLHLCFERDVEKRPSAAELLQHPFCAQIPNDD